MQTTEQNFSPAWLRPDLVDDPSLNCPPLCCDECGKPIVGGYTVIRYNGGDEASGVFHSDTCAPINGFRRQFAKDPFAGTVFDRSVLGPDAPPVDEYAPEHFRSKSIKIPAGGQLLVSRAFHDAAIRVAAAWVIAGRAPNYHAAAKSNLRASWRTLANAVDELADVSGNYERNA